MGRGDEGFWGGEEGVVVGGCEDVVGLEVDEVVVEGGEGGGGVGGGEEGGIGD